MDAAVKGDFCLVTAVQNLNCVVSGFRRQAPQSGYTVIAMVVNLNFTGIDVKAIGCLAGSLGKVHGIAMQRKYRV